MMTSESCCNFVSLCLPFAVTQEYSPLLCAHHKFGRLREVNIKKINWCTQ